jgi:hypothetical protein
MEFIRSSTVLLSMFGNTAGWRDLVNVEEQWVSVAPLWQFVQIQLNFQKVLESKKEFYVIGVEEYADIIENLQYSVDKPDEAKWF